jgi:hypothetical protein
MTAFCDMAPCSLVEVDRRFRGAHVCTLGLLQRYYTAPFPIRLSSPEVIHFDGNKHVSLVKHSIGKKKKLKSKN